MTLRSIPAKAVWICTKARPWGVVVSMGEFTARNPTPVCASRPSRSRSSITTASPRRGWPGRRENPGRSAFAPEARSSITRSQPAASSASSRRPGTRSPSAVEARAWLIGERMPRRGARLGPRPASSLPSSLPATAGSPGGHPTRSRPLTPHPRDQRSARRSTAPSKRRPSSHRSARRRPVLRPITQAPLGGEGAVSAGAALGRDPQIALGRSFRSSPGRGEPALFS